VEESRDPLAGQGGARRRRGCGRARQARGERDRLVALDSYEHRVLTTEQLRRLHFGSIRRARWRL
jgi:hypothetical protein